MPKPKKKKQQAPDSIRLPAELKKKLIERAKKEGRSLSNMIIFLLDTHV
jgi:predicted DNA-binding protein